MQRAAGGMLRKWRMQKEKAAEISAAFFAIQTSESDLLDLLQHLEDGLG